mmetsp:Transcript_20367/g.37049  ORF Transcript_20367/g.37049 Transcript_20367/m.37049 type:complete len:352 (+) Transcript_20367:74-1129(+)
MAAQRAWLLWWAITFHQWGAMEGACLLNIDRFVSKVLPVDEASSGQQETSNQYGSLLEAVEAVQQENSTEDNLAVESTDLELLPVPDRLRQLLCRFKNLVMEARYHFFVSGDQWGRLTEPKELPTARRCALVSNSGVMLKHDYGTEIDAADLVIRFNDAEIGGNLSSKVGAREDVRLLNHLVGEKMLAGEFNLSPNTLYLLSRHRPHDLVVRNWLLDKHGGYSHKDHLVVGTGELENIATKILTSPTFLPFPGIGPLGNPTTGFLGLLVAMSSCEEIHAYGFVESHTAWHSTFHYYGELKKGNAMSSHTHSADHPFADEERSIFAKAALNNDTAESDIAVIPGFSHLDFCT